MKPTILTLDQVRNRLEPALKLSLLKLFKATGKEVLFVPFESIVGDLLDNQFQYTLVKDFLISLGYTLHETSSHSVPKKERHGGYSFVRFYGCGILFHINDLNN